MPSPDPIDFGVLLNRAFAAFRQALDAALAEAGYGDIGRSFGYVLRRLDLGPCTLGELARHLSMTAPGALKIVDEMEAAGYLQRAPDPRDKRAKQLRLTPRGTAVLARAREFHRQYEHALGEQLGRARVEATRSVLEAIVGAADRRAMTMPRPE